MRYLFVGFFLVLAAIVSVYTKLGALLCLVCAYLSYRPSCFAVTFGEEDVSYIREMEVLEETEKELIVRGNRQILILNRSEGTISSLHALITNFEKVRHIRIKKVIDSDSFLSRTTYSVSLSLGMFSAIYVGNTTSQIDASLMAAKLSTWLKRDIVT